MIIDVSAILKETGGHIRVEGDIPFPDTDFLGESFSFCAPVHISGVIANNGKALELKADVSGTMNTSCARCRREITVPVSFPVDEFFIRGEDSAEAEEDVYIFTGYTIDISEVVFNCFIMNAESKYLCSEDCKGLCPMCGADLNLGDCGCSDEQIDPRWEKLKKIMENTDN